MDALEYAEKFIDNGYVAIEAVVSDSSIAELKAIASVAANSTEINICGDGLLVSIPEIVLPIVGNSLILDILERLIGPFVQLDGFTLVTLPSGSNVDIEWHRDIYGAIPRGREFQIPLAVNMLIYLQDLNDEVGCLRVIPGSHRMPIIMTDDERRLPSNKEALIRVKAGTAILLHNNLVHSRSKNNSKSDRGHVSVVYSLSCMKSSIDFSHPAIREMIFLLRRIGSRRLCRLLGEDELQRDRYNSGFLIEEERSWGGWIAEDKQVEANQGDSPGGCVKADSSNIIG